MAERMLEKIEGFIREAREDVEPKGGAETEQPPLELEVTYVYICFFFFFLFSCLADTRALDFFVFDFRFARQRLILRRETRCRRFAFFLSVDFVGFLGSTGLNSVP